MTTNAANIEDEISNFLELSENADDDSGRGTAPTSPEPQDAESETAGENDGK